MDKWKSCSRGIGKAVKSRESFHDALPDSNSNKVSKLLRSTILHFHFYERAKDFCKNIHFSQIKSGTGV